MDEVDTDEGEGGVEDAADAEAADGAATETTDDVDTDEGDAGEEDEGTD
jgi:hypothetical protein